MGKTVGGCGFDYASDSYPKGCHSLASGSQETCVYYGTIDGNDVDSTSITSVELPIYRPEGYPGKYYESACFYPVDSVGSDGIVAQFSQETLPIIYGSVEQSISF